MNCIRCGRELRVEQHIASISGSIMGDEHTDSYYFCPACQVYSVLKCWDNFTGEETASVEGPLTQGDGEKLVAIIRRCSAPWDKKCRCAAHRAYFRGTLD